MSTPLSSPPSAQLNRFAELPAESEPSSSQHLDAPAASLSASEPVAQLSPSSSDTVVTPVFDHDDAAEETMDASPVLEGAAGQVGGPGGDNWNATGSALAQPQAQTNGEKDLKTEGLSSGLGKKRAREAEDGACSWDGQISTPVRPSSSSSLVKNTFMKLLRTADGFLRRAGPHLRPHKHV